MTITDVTTDELAKTLWNYHLMHHKLEKADAILVLGNHDLRIADYAIELFKAGWSSNIIFAGGVTHKNAKLNVFWDAPEARVFADHAIASGVPKEQMLIEVRSEWRLV